MPKRSLITAFGEYCEQKGRSPMSNKAFGMAIQETAARSHGEATHDWRQAPVVLSGDWHEERRRHARRRGRRLAFIP